MLAATSSLSLLCPCRLLLRLTDRLRARSTISRPVAEEEEEDDDEPGEAREERWSSRSCGSKEQRIISLLPFT